jgi:hypothetical protein
MWRDGHDRSQRLVWAVVLLRKRNRLIAPILEPHFVTGVANTGGPKPTVARLQKDGDTKCTRDNCS